jgi:hypothetical protein
MQRGVHILIICAIFPGVILPGQTALCLCEAVACSECRCCAPRDAAPKACCRAHRSTCGESGRSRSSIGEKSACHGCVVLTPHKQTTPKPEPPERDAMPLVAAPVESLALPHAPAATRAPLRQPPSHAPPGEWRFAPLLI